MPENIFAYDNSDFHEIYENLGETGLSKEEEYWLIACAKLGDFKSRNILIKSLDKTTKNLARRYAFEHPQLFHDFCHAGILGIIRAIEKFRPEKNVRLITYAYSWMRKRMGEVKPRNEISLNTQTFEGEAGSTYMDQVTEESPDQEAVLAQEQIREKVIDFIENVLDSSFLGNKEDSKKIVLNHFGFLGEEKQGKFMAEEIGCTGEAVRQTREKAMTLLSETLKSMLIESISDFELSSTQAESIPQIKRLNTRYFKKYASTDYISFLNSKGNDFWGQDERRYTKQEYLQNICTAYKLKSVDEAMKLWQELAGIKKAA